METYRLLDWGCEMVVLYAQLTCLFCLQKYFQHLSIGLVPRKSLKSVSQSGIRWEKEYQNMIFREKERHPLTNDV